MDEMPVKDALAILSRIDGEERAVAQFTQARKLVRDVLTKFQSVVDSLPDLERRKAELVGQISENEAAIRHEEQNKRNAMQERLNEYNKTVEQARLAASEAADKLVVEEQKLDTFVAQARLEVKTLEAKIVEKSEEYASIVEGFNKFKQSHNL